MTRRQGSDHPSTLMALVAWVIGWVGDHDWSALLRLVVLLLACTVALGILFSAYYLVGGRA